MPTCWVCDLSDTETLDDYENPQKVELIYNTQDGYGLRAIFRVRASWDWNTSFQNCRAVISGGFHVRLKTGAGGSYQMSDLIPYENEYSFRQSSPTEKIFVFGNLENYISAPVDQQTTPFFEVMNHWMNIKVEDDDSAAHTAPNAVCENQSLPTENYYFPDITWPTTDPPFDTM